MIHKLVDNNTLFYYSFLKNKTNDEHFFSNQINTPKINTWLGLSFENLCFSHINKIKEKLFINGVYTDVCSKRCLKNEEKGVFGSQIDLLIIRSDKVINLCEIKYSQSEYIPNLEFEKDIKRKTNDLSICTNFKYAIYPTLITNNGLVNNVHSNVIQSLVVGEDLFQMHTFTKQLIKLSDKEYATFTSKLTPNIDPKTILGIRVPQVRKFAKEHFKDKEVESFLNELPHSYFDENMLHGLLIEQIKDYDLCIQELNKFLPYVDNWAVCDICSPKIFKNNKDKLYKEIKKWLKSKDTYTIRFAIEMLMSWYLDEDFKEKYLIDISKIRSNEYYVNMMIAWYFATALAKQYEATIPYIENKKLDIWTHNKTIQKAIESNRITDTQKQYLRTLKIK